MLTLQLDQAHQSYLCFFLKSLCCLLLAAILLQLALLFLGCMFYFPGMNLILLLECGILSKGVILNPKTARLDLVYELKMLNHVPFRNFTPHLARGAVLSEAPSPVQKQARDTSLHSLLSGEMHVGDDVCEAPGEKPVLQWGQHAKDFFFNNLHIF